jgi:hypothetical protein
MMDMLAIYAAYAGRLLWVSCQAMLSILADYAGYVTWLFILYILAGWLGCLTAYADNACLSFLPAMLDSSVI